MSPASQHPRSVANHPIVQSVVERSLAGRLQAHHDEVQRLVDATYRVIGRTGSVDPTVRDILQESGLSAQAFYRSFRSKDELLVVLLDDGRRRLVEYLSHRMDKVEDPAGQIQAYVEGVMSQAADREASARTRPFVVQQHRLAERFAEQQRRSVALLVQLLVDPLRALDRSVDPQRDAVAIYQLSFAAMEQHLLDRTSPGRAEVAHLVSFCLHAVGHATASPGSVRRRPAGTVDRKEAR